MSPFVLNEPSPSERRRRRSVFGWRSRPSVSAPSMSMGTAFARDRYYNSGYRQIPALIQGLVFAVLAITVGLANFSLWVVIPTLVLGTLVVVWWVRSSSARRHDARQEFERRHPTMLAEPAAKDARDARAAPPSAIDR